MKNKLFVFHIDELDKLTELTSQLERDNIKYAENSQTGLDITVATEGHDYYKLWCEE